MILTVEALTKNYPRLRALDSLTLSLPEGSTGLLGPNGAGKSTLIKILLGLIPPTSGTATLLGLDASREPLRARQQVGYMPENECFVPGMNAVEYVCLAGRLIGMPAQDAMQRTHMVLNYIGLHEERYRPIDGYSTGMKQKAKLAQALVHHPKMVLLDEPTSGLDPRARDEMLDLIRDIGRRGVNVVLSTHILPDVERVCDHVAILHRGKLVQQGRLSEILRDANPMPVVRIQGDARRFQTAVEEEGGTLEGLDDGSFRIQSAEGGTTLALRAAVRSGVQIRSLGRRRSSLEEIFEQSLKDTRKP